LCGIEIKIVAMLCFISWLLICRVCSDPRRLLWSNTTQNLNATGLKTRKGDGYGRIILPVQQVSYGPLIMSCNTGFFNVRRGWQSLNTGPRFYLRLWSNWYPPHRECAGGRIGTRFLRPRGTSPLKGVTPREPRGIEIGPRASSA
jgi:hypothetical protein